MEGVVAEDLVIFLFSCYHFRETDMTTAVATAGAMDTIEVTTIEASIQVTIIVILATLIMLVLDSINLNELGWEKYSPKFHHYIL